MGYTKHMYKIAFIVIAAFCVTVVAAQPLLPGVASMHSSFILSLQTRNSKTMAKKSKQLYERVIAQDFHGHQEGSEDSTIYRYVDLNHGSPVFHYETSSYDAYGADTVSRYSEDWFYNVSWYLNNTDIYQYNSNGDIANIVSEGAGAPVSKEIFIYDANNNVIKSIGFQISGSTEDTTGISIYHYNNNLLTADSFYYVTIGNPLPLTRVDQYDYDVNHNLILTTMDEYDTIIIPYSKTINTYTGANQLRYSQIFIYKNNQWVFSNSDSFGYATSSQPYNYHQSYNGSITSISVYHFNSEYLYDTIFNYNLNKDNNGGVYNDTESITYFIYDSLNNPTKVAFLGRSEYTTYYYEPYTPDTIAMPSPVAIAHTNITLYPNPANNTLYISGLEILKGAATISLTNTIGQLVMTQACNSSNIQTVLLAYIPGGVYVLTVSDTRGKRLWSEKVVKK